MPTSPPSTVPISTGRSGVPAAPVTFPDAPAKLTMPKFEPTRPPPTAFEPTVTSPVREGREWRAEAARHRAAILADQPARDHELARRGCTFGGRNVAARGHVADREGVPDGGARRVLADETAERDADAGAADVAARPTRDRSARAVPFMLPFTPASPPINE